MENIIGKSILDQFFDETTMSIHFKENTAMVKKKGRPGEWHVELENKIYSKEDMDQLVDALYKELAGRKDAFLEIDRKLSKVLQIGPYRIVIVIPPLSDGFEMTVVKPTKKLVLSDYDLPADVVDFFSNKAKGILVSGAPGEGKTTFAQALIMVQAELNKVIKTLESPRDLMVPENVVQYSFSYGSHSEIRDILLLSRPDLCVYDEVRNQEDFDLFKDLRLTGIGLIGVIHATNPIDSVQRFIGTIELGIIPQVIDTIVFIRAGKVEQIFELDHVVKVPSGMMSEDLARPVILIKNFYDKKVMYEIYSFGEQVVVMPLDKIETGKLNPGAGGIVQGFAAEKIKKHLTDMFDFPVYVQLVSLSNVNVYVPEDSKGRIIGKGGAMIMDLEKKLGMKINVKTFEELPKKELDAHIAIQGQGKKQNAVISMPKQYAGKNVMLFVGEDLVGFPVDPNAEIWIKSKSLIRELQVGGLHIVEEGII